MKLKYTQFIKIYNKISWTYTFCFLYFEKKNADLFFILLQKAIICSFSDMANLIFSFFVGSIPFMDSIKNHFLPNIYLWSNKFDTTIWFFNWVQLMFSAIIAVHSLTVTRWNKIWSAKNLLRLMPDPLFVIY
jgi:hypothetical protein